MTNRASQQTRSENEIRSSTTLLQWSRDDFSRAQAAAPTALTQAGRACSARELAGGHHIGPITLTLQWLVTKGHVRTEVRQPTGTARPEPVYELTEEGRTVYQRLTTHPPAARPSHAAESRRGQRLTINAIGLLNRSVSDSWLRDERVIIDLSHARGYRLAYAVTIDADTYMPTMLIVWTAHQHAATVVVAPGVEHFPNTSIQYAVALACALVTPTRTTPPLGAPAS